MINPPSAKKYGFWTNDKLPESRMPGSRPRSSTKGRGGRTGVSGSIRMRAPQFPRAFPGKGKLKVIEAAPGAYARTRADET
jgi:polyhydroxyalkanoate synthase